MVQEASRCEACGGRLYDVGAYAGKVEYVCLGGHGWVEYPGHAGTRARWKRDDSLAAKCLDPLYDAERAMLQGIEEYLDIKVRKLVIEREYMVQS